MRLTAQQTKLLRLFATFALLGRREPTPSPIRAGKNQYLTKNTPKWHDKNKELLWQRENNMFI
jgi:hypothetical protein